MPQNTEDVLYASFCHLQGKKNLHAPCDHHVHGRGDRSDQPFKRGSVWLLSDFLGAAGSVSAPGQINAFNTPLCSGTAARKQLIALFQNLFRNTLLHNLHIFAQNFFSHFFSIFITVKANAFIQLFSQIGRQVKPSQPLLVYRDFFSSCILYSSFQHFLSGFSFSFLFKAYQDNIISNLGHTSQNGITYSVFLFKKTTDAPGPGTTSAVIQPVFSSNSTSPT